MKIRSLFYVGLLGCSTCPLSLVTYSSSLSPHPFPLIPFPLYFYFFLFSESASPNGLFFAMSTSTGAATKMDE